MYPPRLLQGNLQPGCFFPKVGGCDVGDWRIELNDKLRDILSKWPDSIRLYFAGLELCRRRGSCLPAVHYPYASLRLAAEPHLGKPGSWARTAIVTVLTCSSRK